MNRDDLQDVQKQKGFPCVTLTLPMPHKSAVELQENHVRFRNAVRAAEERLNGDSKLDKREVGALLAKMNELESAIPFDSPQGGVVVFVSRDFARAFPLPFEAPEAVTIDETFHTRHLVHALNRTKTYYVLTITREVARLYRATRDRLSEVQGSGFPMHPDPDGVMTELPSTHGVDAGQYATQQERNLISHVDNALNKIVGASPDIALMVVGDPKALGYFADISSHKENLLGTVQGNYEKLSLNDLSEKVWPAAREGFAARRDRVHQIFDDAAANLRAEGLNECWFVAHEGRIGTLMVEEGFQQAGRVSEDGMNLETADDAAAEGVLDDAVDELIEAVLGMSGRVTFFESGALEKHGRVCATLRY